MKATADAARQALHDKYGKKPEVSGCIPPEVQAATSNIDPDDLIQLGIVGAEHMVDGAVNWDDWQQKFMADIGDTVRRWRDLRGSRWSG